MEIKCSFHPVNVNNHYTFEKQRVPQFRGQSKVLVRELGENADKFIRRPVAEKSAAGLRGLKQKLAAIVQSVGNYFKKYKQNIKHTFDHKIVFAMVEKELFGKNSIDSITHDLDKLILYTLGFSRDFVSRVHRAHSEHHCESNKKPNLRSMICDNIASSPEFKPEKKLSLREYYKISDELQHVDGFGEILEKYNYGENIDFSKIKLRKAASYGGTMSFVSGLMKMLPLIFTI